MTFINRERIVCTVSHCKSVTKYLEYLNINVEKYIKYWSRADYVAAHEGLCQRRWSHRQAYFTACSVQTLHVTYSNQVSHSPSSRLVNRAMSLDQ